MTAWPVPRCSAWITYLLEPVARQGLAQAVGLVPEHHHEAFRFQGVEGVEDPGHHRPSPDRM